MPPPLFILFIPSVALFFLIQMVICHAYHFQVTLGRQKSKAPPKIEMNSGEDKDPDPQGKGNGNKGERNGRNPQGSPLGKNDAPSQRRQGRRSEDSTSLNKSTAGSRDLKNPNTREPILLSMESQNDSTTPVDRPKLVSNHQSESGEFSPEKVDHLSPKEDRIRNRRKSVFAESYDPAKDDENEKVVHPKTPDEKKHLRETLEKITLFQHLANDQLNTVVDAMYKYPVNEGDYITREGDKGNTFYVIQDGLFDVFVRGENDEEQLVHTYDQKGSFGELALLYNQPRAASIVARSQGTLWAVDGQTFRRIVYKITHQKRVMYESLINNVPMLKALEPYERANLVDALIPMSFQHDQQIVKQGDEADGMYFIVSGGVRVLYLNEDNKEVLLNELSNSDYFGELALVADQPRAASAYSVGTTHLAFLDREAFERLLGPCMKVMRRKIDDYNDRLSQVLKVHK